MYQVYEYNNLPWHSIKQGLCISDERQVTNVSAFDIETTTIKKIERSFLYSWQLCLFNKYIIYGRKIEQFVKLLDKLSNYFKDYELKIFVHNLSYEFIFLFPYVKTDITDYFAKDTHNILYFKYKKNIYFNCSYNLTNMSLEKFLKNENVEHLKIKGYNYGKTRFYNTKISRFDKQYAIQDVTGLCQALEKKAFNENCTIWDFPLTSTGYVRKGIKKDISIFDIQNLRNEYNKYDIYKRLLSLMRGGDTHGNRFYRGKIIEREKSTEIAPAVICYDKISSYPYQLISKKYPLKKFEKADKIPKNKPFIVTLKLYNLYTTHLNPYISISKCKSVRGSYCDNGRIVSAEYIEIDVIDIDYNIILNEYNFTKKEESNIYVSEWYKLPDYIINYVIELFKQKTDLKKRDEYFYKKVKNLINSIYGCMASKIVYEDFKLNEDGYFDCRENLIKQKYRNQKNKVRIPFIGAWVTGWARKELRELINIAGESFLYCDTDSVFFKYDKNIIKKIDIINWKIENFRSYKYKGYCMGIWEVDKIIKKFKFYGAKKYCYEDYNGETKICVAGVPVRKYGIKIIDGVKYASEHYHDKLTINDFDENLVFKNANLKAVYQFNINEDYTFCNGYVKYNIKSSLALIPTDYTLANSVLDIETLALKYKSEVIDK